VIITTGDTLLLRGHSAITTEARQADGGNIQVTAQTLVRLRDSQITTAVGSGTGRGGNITIDPQFVILERSQLVADAFGGPGGNITIVAQGFVPDAASRVSASSALAAPGEVNIQALTNVSGVVAPLPQQFLPAAALLSARCAERRRAGRSSSLVLGGRDGVPREPGALGPSPLARAVPPGQAEGGGPPEPREAAVGGLRVNDTGSSLFKEKAVQRFSSAVDWECAKGRAVRHP
jgi:large exoprotein involved in heme utilization and adhesion